MHNVAVAQNVLFAFKAQAPSLTGTLLSLILNEIIIGNRLGPCLLYTSDAADE